MKAVVFSLGCKVNFYEGQGMIAVLKTFGIEAEDKLTPADFYILNTCSVTAEADRKSRQAVSRVLKLNPSAKVYVCGCGSAFSKSAYEEKEAVRLISGTRAKAAFAEDAFRDFSGLKPINRNAPGEREYEDFCTFSNGASPELTRTRGIVKVQDGCDNFCSYCIVPHLRGRSRSRSIDSAVSEAKRAANASPEIVITGINLSAYGADNGGSLTGLVRALSCVSARKRLGSLECEVIDEEFLSAVGESGFCPHFHLSLQSGSDAVLKRMNRRYDAAYFLSRVNLIRRFFPDAGITTDIIAGFPGETEAEHKDSLDTVIKAGFSDAHVFPYSRRQGTPAAEFRQVEKKVRVERAAELALLAKSLRAEFLQNRIGRIYGVCFEEEAGPGIYAGYTENYLRVFAKAADRPKGIVRARLCKVADKGVEGEIL